MKDIPEDELEDARAALAPTLEATAAILPWLAKPRVLRFAAHHNARWIEAGKRLHTAWSDRHGAGAADIRSAIFTLYAIALETADADCLRLGEALASAADQLESSQPGPHLIAALTASSECLNEPEGLEHKLFAERARHFAQRLEVACQQTGPGKERSVVLDRIFVAEAGEHLSLMLDALARLPIDAYAVKTEALTLAEKAELLELYGLMHMGRQLAARMNGEISELDSDASRAGTTELLQQLAKAIAAVDT